jgi:hypothetical protein
VRKIKKVKFLWCLINNKCTSFLDQLIKLLIEEPELAERLLQQLTLHIFIECLGAKTLSGGLQSEQICTPLRITIDSDVELRDLPNEQKGLILYKGILTACTLSSKYV